MAGCEASRVVRPSPIAGTWYPGGQKQLQATVDGLIAKADKPALPGAVVALISPHAGYPYSGAIAAHAYAQVQGAPLRTVALLGPDHRGAAGAFGVADYRFFETPLGKVEVDSGLLQRLGAMIALDKIEVDEEHSLEIQLPFLQRVLGQFTLLPITMGYPLMPRAGEAGRKACQLLSRALVEVLAGRDDVLLVASTDLSHLYDYHQVVRYDRLFTTLVAQFDADKLSEALSAGQCHACGGAAVVTVMMVAKARGARSATVLAYANSGDVTGRKTTGDYTVGYAAAAITAPLASLP
jgi:AmmeMemoRadiSam system protein B